MSDVIASDLLAKVKACTLCEPELPMGANPILQYSPKAKILIAGQAPGRITHQKGRPFDDPSGKRLREWLGIDEATFYNPELFAIVPMGFCFPGTGKQGDLPPRSECAETWHTQLLAGLTQLSLVLVIGQYARAHHLPESEGNLTQAVAAWQDSWPLRMVLPHPSPRNNRWLKNNPWFAEECIPAIQTRVAALTKNTGQ